MNVRELSHTLEVCPPHISLSLGVCPPVHGELSPRELSPLNVRELSPLNVRELSPLNVRELSHTLEICPPVPRFMDDWNAAWPAAQKSASVEIKY